MQTDLRLSQRVKALEPSATMALASKAKAMQRAGRPVISLTAGEPDFPTPEAIVQAAIEAMRGGKTHYTDAAGAPEVRETLIESLKKEGLELESSDSVLLTPGAKQAIHYAAQALLDPGDKVLLLEPAWVSYRQIVGLAQAEVVALDLDPDKDFALDPERLETLAAAHPEIRMLILNSPSNPTGRVLSRAELEAVAKVAEAHDWVVVSDEIYGKLVFGGATFTRAATIPGLAERTITIDGFSKSHAMTGWRLGWAAGPTPWIQGMKKLQMHSATCPAEFVQWAGRAGLLGCEDTVQSFSDSYAGRARLVEELFSRPRGLRVPTPQGAFYAFLDARKIDSGDDVALAARILEEAEVALIPGSAFGAPGRGFLRMSFAAAEEDLRQAAQRLEVLLGT